MEPMNLGSPPSSPGSPNPNFLPAFLMGDSQPTSPNPATSPGRNKTPMLKMQANYANTPTNLRQKLFNQSLGEFSITQSNYSSPIDKGGPPKQGLFDTIDSKPKSPILNSTMAQMSEPAIFSPGCESFSRIGNDSLNYSRNLNDRAPFQNTGNTNLNCVDTLWVTIFGFLPSTTCLVLAQLANCGTIIEKKYPTQGNWIHIKFSTPHEVAKALLMNGNLISNCIMVGVVPYYNKQDMNKENFNISGYTSPVRARSLRNSYIPNQSANTVLSPQNVPQKSTGIVTKAMEYVFGW